MNSERVLSQQFKQALGKLNILDHSQTDTISAHNALGRITGVQVRRILVRRFFELGNQEGVASAIRNARSAQAGILDRISSPKTDKLIQQGLKEYNTCLKAWATGAGLDQFFHALLPQVVDGKRVDPTELALFLQEDETGCQTGALRNNDGSVILWHTEEDVEKMPGDRFDALRIFQFRAMDGGTASAFVYPDLLPGPSFAWHNAGLVQAIDTLHVRNSEDAAPILPNILTWLSLYMGTLISRQELAEQLAPFRGGYAITAGYHWGEQVAVEKVEFANDTWQASHLGEAKDCFFFQTNIIERHDSPVGMQEQASTESRMWNESRLIRTKRRMKSITAINDTLTSIFRLIQSRAGNESAYSNHDVKAYLVCKINPERTQIWVGCGAPQPKDELFHTEL